MTSDPLPRLGFVGAGSLGGPAVHRLVGAGYAVRLTVRDEQRRAEWSGHGVEVVATAAEAAVGADVLIVFVFSDDQVRDVLGTALDRLAEGAVVVVHSTVSTATLDRVGALAESRGVRLVDAPVSGTAEDIERGTLTVLAGGADDALTLVEPVLGAYADPIVRVGRAGDATRLKLVNNIVFAANVQIAAAATQLSARLGVDPARCASALLACSGASGAMGYLAMFDGDLDAFAERARPYLAKDVAACLRAAAELDVPLDLLADVVRSGPLDLG